jgi:ATP-dependent Lhr-like helicase
VLFAGRRWQVTTIDDRRKELTVIPARGRKKPKFQGSSGEIHPRVREAMRDVLISERTVPYLNAEGAEMLADARNSARQAGLDHSSLVAVSASSTLWFTWTGTKVHQTLLLLTNQAGLACTDNAGIALEFSLSPDELCSKLAALAKETVDQRALAESCDPRELRKYDEFVGEELLLESIVSERLECETAISMLNAVRT